MYLIALALMLHVSAATITFKGLEDGGPLVDGNVGAVLGLNGYTLEFAIPVALNGRPLRESKNLLQSFTPVAEQFTIPDLSQVDQTAGEPYISHIVELDDSSTFPLMIEKVQLPIRVSGRTLFGRPSGHYE